MSSRTPRCRWAVLGTLSALAVAGCGGQAAQPSASTLKAHAAAQLSSAQVRSNVSDSPSKFDLDKRVRLSVHRGQWQSASVTGPGGRVPGKFSADQGSWHTTADLRPNASYVATGVAVDSHGLRQTYRSEFHTRKLTLDEQTYPSFVPAPGDTVGVGMPVIIRFDVPVTRKAAFERRLQVTSSPAQTGSFHWISDNEVHWRPKTYWKPNTKVTVKADIGGVYAGHGVYGQKDRKETFDVGRDQVIKVNADTDQLHVVRNGRTIKTIPITTGKPGFTTRSGTKVIVEKDSVKRMNSETIGIDPNSANGYDIGDVRWAMRLTYSGEFLHAAPWSVSSQGVSNVSHGCTGMSTSNAYWLYEHSMVGDPVEYTGTSRSMTLTNGYGDWNESFKEYKKGSALD